MEVKGRNTIFGKYSFNQEERIFDLIQEALLVKSKEYEGKPYDNMTIERIKYDISSLIDSYVQPYLVEHFEININSYFNYDENKLIVEPGNIKTALIFHEDFNEAIKYIKLFDSLVETDDKYKDLLKLRTQNHIYMYFLDSEKVSVNPLNK